jgi:hypothetical protein
LGKQPDERYKYQIYNLRALIISKQPPAVLKAGDRFETEARLLAKSTGVSPILRIRIIGLEDAVKLNSGEAKCEEM